MRGRDKVKSTEDSFLCSFRGSSQKLPLYNPVCLLGQDLNIRLGNLILILGGCEQLKSPVTELGHQPPVVANRPPTTHVEVGGQLQKPGCQGSTGSTPKSNWEVRKGCLENKQEFGEKRKVQGKALR